MISKVNKETSGAVIYGDIDIGGGEESVIEL
jgi:hypothetical protein